jgi:poly-gamma-glutamate capsule biosynthesis protein CapA/YwtB (metallophosphatase superfamily)
MTGLQYHPRLSGKDHRAGRVQHASDAQTVRLMTLRGQVAALHLRTASPAPGARKSRRNTPICSAGERAALSRTWPKRAQAGADVLIVSLNWGADNKTAPTKAKALAQKLADGRRT